jgi:hypothetical protein
LSTHEQIAACCHQLGLAPTAAELKALGDFLALLQHWNSTYNLTAVRDPRAMVTQHLADCLTVLPSLQARCPQGRVLDVGSGGGLPGVVLAIMQPALAVTCVDAVGKKAAFIRQVAGQLQLPNLQAFHARIQDLKLPALRPDHLARLCIVGRLHTMDDGAPGAGWSLDGHEGSVAPGRDSGIAAQHRGVSRGTIERTRAGCRTLPGVDASPGSAMSRLSRSRRGLSAGLLASLVAAAAFASPEAGSPGTALTPLPSLNVPAYMGTWYQVAWFPNRFQKQCVSDTTAPTAAAPARAWK